MHAPSQRVQPLLQIKVEQIINEYIFKGCQIMNFPRMPPALDLAMSLALFFNMEMGKSVAHGYNWFCIERAEFEIRQIKVSVLVLSLPYRIELNLTSPSHQTWGY